MRFLSYMTEGRSGIAVDRNGEFIGILSDDPQFPGDLAELIRRGADALQFAHDLLIAHGDPVDLEKVETLPPLIPEKIICVGLNYADHAAEANMQVPETPTLFSRFSSSLIGAGAPIGLPRVSSALDYEGELVAVVGRGGRYIDEDGALDHIAGYSMFNDASLRDYQTRTTQWMIGKNFDATGAFGPLLVTADELPAGASGLRIQTRLNGETVQDSNTDQLIFNVAKLVAAISEAITLVPGDLIVTGTPSGVGNARVPRLFMKDGDVCEVEIERIGVLRNPVAADG